MKRVIEIEEDRYDVLQKLEKATHGTGYMNYFEETIANSTPLDEVLDKITEEIDKAKQYRGKSGNSVIDKHNIGLDRYFDLGLDKALKIINKYKESEE